MAKATLTSEFGDLDQWPGNLLQADDSTVVTSRSSTEIRIRHGEGSPFEGYRVVVTGSGFTYKDGVPTGGTMSSVRVLAPNGDTVITFASLKGPIASDLSQFHANMFGSANPNAGPGPDGKTAWSHLLSGNDVVEGTGGDDRRTFTGLDAGNDTYDMGGGDDVVTGGIGDDTYRGGSGYDFLTFRDTTWNEGMSAARGATFDVGAGRVRDPWGGTDRIGGFEAFEGSRFDDTFYGGNDRDDAFSGLRGRDVIDGGARTFSGGGQTGDDEDRVGYRDDYWNGGRFGVAVDLETSASNGSIRGTARDGFGNRDTLIDIERVEGTRFGDSFTGSRVDNQFWGGQGRDTFAGGGGSDRVNFDLGLGSRAPGGIAVDLGRSSGQVRDDGFGNVESLSGIEEIGGTNRADTIRMNGEDNAVQAGDGRDVLTGAGGEDVFYFIDDVEFGDGDRITDFRATGGGRDRLGFDAGNFDGMTTTLRLVNGTGPTTGEGTFIFDPSTDTLYWDRDGTGSAGRQVVAVLPGVDALTGANFDLY